MGRILANFAVIQFMLSLILTGCLLTSNPNSFAYEGTLRLGNKIYMIAFFLISQNWDGAGNPGHLFTKR